MGHISNPPTVPNNHCPTLRHFPPKESGAADQFLQKIGNLRNETLCWLWIERAMEGSNKTPYEPSNYNTAGRTGWLWKGLTRPLMSPTTCLPPGGSKKVNGQQPKSIVANMASQLDIDEASQLDSDDDEN
jgi:hypothetical protein